MDKILMLHPAGVTPQNFAKLVGPIEGFEVVYPRAAKDLYWNMEADMPALRELGGCFIAGFSRGAFMAARASREIQYKGMMILAGGLLRPYAASWERPCPVLLCHGTADTVVPYAGKAGPLGYLGAMDSATALATLNGCGASKVSAVSKTVRLYDWGKVRLYRCDGAGHTYPGSKAWQPSTLGKVDPFPLTATMAEFFRGLA